MPAASLPLEITVTEVESLRRDTADFLLLDCREVAENEFASIEGSVLVPMGEIQQRAAELDEFREKRVIVHCHHGGRSLMVTQWLRQNGFAQAQNMAGGIDAWSLEVDDSIPRYQ